VHLVVSARKKPEYFVDYDDVFTSGVIIDHKVDYFDYCERPAGFFAGLCSLPDRGGMRLSPHLADNSLPSQSGESEMNFILRLLAAVIYDILDALDVVPVIGDAVETGAAFLVARWLGVRSKWIIAGVTLEGLLPPPLDFFPAMTVGLLVDSFLSRGKKPAPQKK